jgi:hypothetical protein
MRLGAGRNCRTEKTEPFSICLRRLTTRTLAPSPILEPLITFECLWPTEQFTYAATHGDTSTAKLMAHRGRRDAQLGTDLAQSTTVGVQVGRSLNVHRA